MNNYLETLIIAIFFTILSGATFFGGQKNADQIEKWVQGEAVIESVREDHDSDSGYVYYYATINYTAEDGEECTVKNVHIPHEPYPGEVVPIIYDPDTKDTQYGDTPPDESSLHNIMFLIFSAITVVTYAIAGYQIFRSYHPKKSS